MISLFIHHLVWCDRQGINTVGTHIEGRRGSLGIPQGGVHKILTYHKQQIFSDRIEHVVSLKSLPLNIKSDIDLVCPTSSFFNTSW